MKVAVLLPKMPDYGWIWRLRVLLASIETFAESDFQIVVGIEETNAQDVISALCIRPGTRIHHRIFDWLLVDAGQAGRMFPLLAFDYSGINCVRIPRDWGWNFTDCDVWLVLGESGQGALLPLRPTLIYVRELIDRYLFTCYSPQQRQESCLSWRQCQGALGSTRAIFDNLTAYCGMPQYGNVLLPQLFPVFSSNVEIERSNSVASFGRFDDYSSTEIACRAIARVQRTISLTAYFVIDGFGLSEIDKTSRQTSLECLVERNAANIQVVVATKAEDIETNLRNCSVILSCRSVAGEPDELLLAIAARKMFVGARNPQIIELFADCEAITSILTSFDENLVVQALFKAISREPPFNKMFSSNTASYSPNLSSLWTSFFQLASRDPIMF